MSSEPYLASIVLFAGNFAPRGYASCEGQTMSIAQNTALFSLLGTTYGGNGQTTFALPDYRGRAAIGQGQGPGLSPYVEGQRGGSETVTLIANQLPAHTHPLSQANAKAVIGARTEAPTTTNPKGHFIGGGNIFVDGQTAPNGGLNIATVAFGQGAITDPSTGGQPVSIVQPYLSIFFIIALEGIFPSRN